MSGWLHLALLIPFLVISATGEAAMLDKGSGQQGRFPSEDSSGRVTAAPDGSVFQARKFKMALFGKNYRQEWITKVSIPVFDFKQEKGGLTIIKQGGGDQTTSFRLIDNDGKEWVLRSLDKEVADVIPENVRIGMAEDVVKDQMSASLPWAALAIPRIADAASIFHTNPKVVYLRKDSLPQVYQPQFKEGLFLFEERPEGDRKEIESFGRSKKIVGTDKMMERVSEKPDHTVDQEHFLRSRMVDMLISDWDRHEDQWRWATFKEYGKTSYKAIPRDRDMALYVSEGVAIKLSSKTPFLRKMQGLDDRIKDIKGLNYQARHLDRRFLNELTLDEWLNTAKRLKENITDSVLRSAIHDMPEPVAAIHGEQTISKLMARRDSLTVTAEQYYRIVNQKVDVVGTDNPEVFLVERLNDNRTKVTVFSTDGDDGAQTPYYQRVFDHEQTREIRLYGGDGDDTFRITGVAKGGMKLRIIGENGFDQITDSSRVKGLSKKTVVYDNRHGYNIISEGEIRKVTTRRPGKFIYRYDAFDYNRFFPLLLLGYNTDDGIFMGAGVSWKTFGFMKEPFSTQHRVALSYSFTTKAFELSYSGTITDFVKELDLKLNFDFRDPKYTQNYFGMGNETVRTTNDKDYNRVRIGQILINPQLMRRIGKQGSLAAGLFYENVQVEDTEGRYISDFSVNGLNEAIFTRKDYLGINFDFTFDSRDNELFPKKGLHLTADLRSVWNIHDLPNPLLNIGSEASLFFEVRKPFSFVVAMRAGGALNIGKYEFFQANSIGGKESLRGYRDTRYSGDISFYQNTEIRVRLLQVKSYISKGHFGLLLFNDVGRVWWQGEKSRMWHHGYGGGLWISPFGMTIVNFIYERSADEREGLFSVRFGFLF